MKETNNPFDINSYSGPEFFCNRRQETTTLMQHIQNRRHTAFFASCSPIAPAYLHAYMYADEIYARNLQNLQLNIHRFNLQISNNQLFSFLPNYPVYYTLQDDLYDFLFENGIFIYSFAYPIKAGKPNTRIVLSAWHEEEQIDFLAEKCKEFSQI